MSTIATRMTLHTLKIYYIYYTHTLPLSSPSPLSLSLSLSHLSFLTHSLTLARSLALTHSLPCLFLISHFAVAHTAIGHFMNQKVIFKYISAVCRRVHVYSAHIFVSVGASVIQRHFHCALHCSQSTMNLSGRT